MLSNSLISVIIGIFQGANILVDNKACIKLADFGASKRVEALVCCSSLFVSFCYCFSVLILDCNYNINAAAGDCDWC